jgi:lysine 2,3-aminomutase
MSSWQSALRESSVTSLDKLANEFGHHLIDVEGLKPVIDSFQMRLTPNVLTTIREAGDPIWQQYVPTTRELEVHDAFIDPLDEDSDSPVPNITHRYSNRALLLVSPVCASYCRFCSRRRKVGDPEKIPLNQFDSAFSYLNEHTEIREVILTGGDPMMLSDRRLEYFFQQLRLIGHVQIIRLESRITSQLPSRITRDFCEMARKYHPVYMTTHFNHPAELTDETVTALGMLADAGIPLGCQTVLLRGINDDPVIMSALMEELVKARVRPYYILMADPVAGGEHFRTTVQKGFEIVQALRGWTSGLGVPQLVIDLPGGGGKVPLLPEYVEEIDEDTVIVRNYEGKRFIYEQPRVARREGEIVDRSQIDRADVVPIDRGERLSKRLLLQFGRKSQEGWHATSSNTRSQLAGEAMKSAHFPVSELTWLESLRTVPAKFPPLELFNGRLTPDEIEHALNLESRFETDLQTRLSLIPARERVYGEGAGFVMSAFLLGGAGRFSDSRNPAYYAANKLKTAIAESAFHLAKVYSATNESAIQIQLRILKAEIRCRAVNLCDAKSLFPQAYQLSSIDYGVTQRFAKEARREGFDAILYDSVRDSSGKCVAVFRPTVISNCRTDGYALLSWDGIKMSMEV